MNILFKITLIVLSLTFAVSAFQNHRYPISPILYYSALPNPMHTEVSSELSMESRGAFSYSFSQNAQQAIALKAPLFHIFSARETYFKFHEDPKDLSDTLNSINRAQPTQIYKRMYFVLGSGVSLSHLGMNTKNFNAALGVHYMSRLLDPEGNNRLPGGEKELLERSIVPSATVRYKKLQGSLLFSDFNITSKAGMRGTTWQAGAKLTILADVEKSFEVSLAGEKIFYDAITIKGHFGGQWLSNEIYQQTYSFNTSLRFRPYNSKKDPSWLRLFIDPLQFEVLSTKAKSHPFSHFIYNIEVGVGVYSDIETKDTFTNMTISKLF
ncbi:MAG: hypothetical protein OCC49_17930 [Fibrobacterales bacterium]